MRNRAWVASPLLDLLRKHGIAYAIIDHPWMPTIEDLMKKHDPVTADFAYVRWLGDRKGIEARTTTWEKLIVDRTPEMERWVPAGLLTRNIDLYGYFNHYAGHAPGSIALLREIWRQWLNRPIRARLALHDFDCPIRVLLLEQLWRQGPCPGFARHPRSGWPATGIRTRARRGRNFRFPYATDDWKRALRRSRRSWSSWRPGRLHYPMARAIWSGVEPHETVRAQRRAGGRARPLEGRRQRREPRVPPLSSAGRDDAVDRRGAARLRERRNCDLLSGWARNPARR
jgi:hypothetical protein